MNLKVVKRKTLNVALASSMVVSFFAPGVIQKASAAVTTDDLIISEYIEGSSYNKAIEIFNGTGTAVDLSNYSLEIHTNGASSNKTFGLTGTLNSGEVYVIAHPSSSTEILAKADIENGTIANFSGNDPLTLLKGQDVIDSIGQLGESADFGKDVTLVRKASVTTGDKDASDLFDPAVEWNSLTANDISNLGIHGEEAPPAEPVTLSTIAEARKGEKGSAVKVEGIATAAFVVGGSTNLFIQDETAGIVVRAAGITAEPGDEVVVEGTLDDYFGLAQVTTSSSDVKVKTKAAGVPAAEVLTGSAFKSDGEKYEGTFVEFNNITVVSVSSYGDFTVTDGTEELMITPKEKTLLEAGKTYDVIRGVIDYSYSNYKLVPRAAADVVADAFSVAASPGSGTVVEGTEVVLQTETEGGTIHYTTDGSEPTAASPVYSSPIQLTSDITIKAIVAKEEKVSEVSTFVYDVVKPADNLEIHDIQGESHASPYKDMTVSGVEGIVTAKNGSNGFYMQTETPDDNDKTSEGIYVYSKGNSVSIGDKVSVDGMVAEYREGGYSDAKDLLTTQISASAVSEVSSGNTLPEAVVIGMDRTPPTENIEDDNMTKFEPETDGLDFYESLEGMLIEIPDATITGPVKYDELPVIVNTSEDQLRSKANGLLITPADYNPERMLIDVDGLNIDAKTGDTLDGSVTGVVSYDYSNFKIRPTGSFPQLVDGGMEREVTTIDAAEEELTVATYNVENFHKGVGKEKIERIAESIVVNMKTPDIVGLVEVQDNDGPADNGVTSASESYQAIIDAIEAAGGPTYEFTEVAPEDKVDGGQPGGNIRVGFIYNPERVELTDKDAGDAATAVGVTKDGLTHNPGRVAPTDSAFEDSRKPLAAEFMFNGEKVIVVNNHMNSKGGDGALFGAEHPVVLGSEVQRMEQAAILNEFVNDIVTNVEDANVVMMGDLNDFEFSAPIKTLKGDIMTNMMEKLPVEERYTYNYQGNSQILDHILVTNNLADNTEIDSININSDFSEAHGRASDHDPVLASISFEEEAAAPGVGVDRISGEDRYQTAIEVSKKGWDSAETVVIARGDEFPDALAGAPLAYKLDAPILLTDKNYMSKEVMDEIKRLGAKKAVVLGGNSAVSKYVDYQIKGIGLETERITGENRFETAANIAARLGGSPEKAVIANAHTFADALSVASFAAQNGYPIVLAEHDLMPEASTKAIKNIGGQIVVGGENAIGTKVFNSLSDAERYSGENRYETSAQIAKSLTPVTDKAIIATGYDFADALTGSVLAAKAGAEILLVKPTEVPASILEVIEADQIRDFQIVGGETAIGNEVIQQLKGKE
ncbi:MAG: cell wall-binding repeat-containing protein [Bacillota bacterium]